MFKRPWIANLTLLFISVLLASLFAEWAFRVVLFGENSSFSSLRNPADYVSSLTYNGHPVYEEDYWKLNYLFYHKFNVQNPHPLLGWIGMFDRNTLNHQDQDKVQKRRPVLLYGDSFAQCADGTTCFQDFLNQDSTFTQEHYFLNYGVGGYGVDQIYLLFNETVDRFEDPFVIFSLLTTDLDRSMLPVRDAQKPYFLESEKGIKLMGTPIELTSSEYFESNPPQITSYLFNRIFRNFLDDHYSTQKRADEYMEEIKSLNTLILGEAFNKLRKMDGEFIVLLFQPEHHGLGDWRLPFLRELLEENEIPYICDYDIRERDSKGKEYDPFTYALEDDGHPTSYFNGLISEELKNCINNSDYRAQAVQYSLDWRERKPNRGVEYYRELISESPEWLEQIKAKAEDKGISVDSMLTLDAIYMVNH